MPEFRIPRVGNSRLSRHLSVLMILAGAISGAAKPLVAETPTRDSAASSAPSPAEQVDLEGDLSVLVEDREDGAVLLYSLEVGGERYVLRGVEPSAGLQTGMRVRARGVRANGEITLEGPSGLAVVREDGAGAQSVQALSALPNTLGAQKTAVILVTFSNNPQQPYTVAEARNMVFTSATSVSNFFLENSYGQTWLTGDVFGWYKIALTTSACNFDDIATQGRAAAIAAGVNMASYSRYVYAFPRIGNCPGTRGTIGGSPSTAWIGGTLNVLNLLTHEMGHNLGLLHSHSVDCGSVILGTSCTRYEYGDRFDTMGGSAYHYNAFQKERLGWLSYGASPPLATVTASGTYAIDAYETAGSAAKGLKIARGTTGQYLYVEARKNLGWDDPLSDNPNVIGGVLIHMATPTDPDSSDILDMTLHSSFDTFPLDPALTVGQSFTDSVSGVTITTTAVTPTGATVSVTMGGGGACVRSNPLVSLSPGQGAGVAAGSPVSYAVSVTNRDGSGCAASVFDLTNAVPAGWTGSISPASLTLSPSAAGSATFQVTSASTATNGSYGVSATAQNRGATSYTATGSATYVVSNPVCTAANPTVSLTPAQGAGVAAGTMVPFTLSVTNNDGTACSAATFDLTNAVPAGWTGNLGSAALTLSPGGTGSTTLQVSSAASSANGSYGVSATAKNRAAPGYTATATATYVVTNPCTRANPVVTISPATGSGPSGALVSYTVSVANSDSVACTASTFDLTRVVPSGWTGTLAASALTISPGAGASTTLQVTSASTAVNGSFGITLTAKNRAATSYSATASATYVVSNPVCVRANPTVALTPSQNPGVAAGTPVPFTVTVTNNDNGACTASNFDLTRVVPAGWTGSLSSAVLGISPGASAGTTLLVTSPVTAASGSYPVSATAKNGATSYQATSSAAFLIASLALNGTVSDNFDRPDSSTPGSAWLEAAGDLVINGNKLKSGPGVSGTDIAVVAALSGPAQTVDADFTSVNNNLGPRFGLVLRYQDSQNYYLLYRATGGSSRLLISRVVGGVETILASVGIANPTKLVAFHLTARATGTGLSLDFNGVNKLNFSDSVFASGKVGVLLYNTLTTVQQEVDNFTATVQ